MNLEITPQKFGPNWAKWPAMDTATDCPVKTMGLDRIIWKGSQWAVTEYGIERCDGYAYEIASARLLENPHHSWIEHMAEKGGSVDLPDFAAAFGVAVAYHLHRWGRK